MTDGQTKGPGAYSGPAVPAGVPSDEGGNRKDNRHRWFLEGTIGRSWWYCNRCYIRANKKNDDDCDY